MQNMRHDGVRRLGAARTPRELGDPTRRRRAAERRETLIGAPEARRVVVAVAPNGGRRTKADHPALPLTAGELARTAAECLEQGASMIHLHVRDQAGKHLLDAEAYRAATAHL